MTVGCSIYTSGKNNNSKKYSINVKREVESKKAKRG
jgi:hypothetical protein